MSYSVLVLSHIQTWLQTIVKRFPFCYKRQCSGQASSWHSLFALCVYYYDYKRMSLLSRQMVLQARSRFIRTCCCSSDEVWRSLSSPPEFGTKWSGISDIGLLRVVSNEISVLYGIFCGSPSVVEAEIAAVKAKIVPMVCGKYLSIYEQQEWHWSEQFWSKTQCKASSLLLNTVYI